MLQCVQSEFPIDYGLPLELALAIGFVKSLPLSTKPKKLDVDVCSGLPLHKNMQWQATAQPLGEFVAEFPDFVAKCRVLLPLEEFVATCEKTVQVPFPHPTLTSKSHTTNNTMIDYYPSAATTANAAADSPEALPLTMTRISVATRMARRMTLRTRRQMMTKGWRTRSFAQQETSRTERLIASGQLVWRTATFKKKLA